MKNPTITVASRDTGDLNTSNLWILTKPALVAGLGAAVGGTAFSNSISLKGVIIGAALGSFMGAAIFNKPPSST